MANKKSMIVSKSNSKKDIRGTFLNNMKKPIHRWFRFPAGYSYNIVEDSFKRFNVNKNSLVLDPFAGSGTTNVCAKTLGIKSIGIESHFFAAWVAQVKTYWNFDLNELQSMNENLFHELSSLKKTNSLNERINDFPELIHKCYANDKLEILLLFKEHIMKIKEKHYRDFCFLALISILRKVSNVHTGWPYVIPKKSRPNNVDVLTSFQNQIDMMTDDLSTVVTNENKNTLCKIEKFDSRNLTSKVDDDRIDFVFTSPPYLNNFDYADRTRLELYFATPYNFDKNTTTIKTWGNLRTEIRSKLIVSATHQAKELGLKEGLLPNEHMDKNVQKKLLEISNYLREEKSKHGGHKEYDLLVVGYFNDMFKIMKEVFQVLKNDSYFLLILGDSAPYGKHVQTDILLSKIARGIGFKQTKIEILRKRGGKWASAPKHDIPLRESMLILKK